MSTKTANSIMGLLDAVDIKPRGARSDTVRLDRSPAGRRHREKTEPWFRNDTAPQQQEALPVSRPSRQPGGMTTYLLIVAAALGLLCISMMALVYVLMAG